MTTARPQVLVVTGTDTDVGKTVVTAALAALLRDRAGPAGDLPDPDGVAVVKPVQTGADGDLTDDGDLSVVTALSGVTTLLEAARLPAPMAPRAAARLAGRALPPVREQADAVLGLARAGHQVLVEGAGGLLVELDDDGATLADLAALVGAEVETGVVVVCRPGLGTLNHTALTLEALHARGLTVAGTVIGCWPDQPGPIELDNRAVLTSGTGPFDGVPLLGAVPERAPLRWPSPEDFHQMASGVLRLPGHPAHPRGRAEHQH